ncbi:uncharacterized protein BKA55DRAFT_562211 [Fusarium redolens]|uniref:Aminoglycoside phosphotransferase domain-containing protein n=1 Tax=Fusarium redolens TaxID=48865 RepID=A0A9P9HLL7_FUSRE|nr:uncharacterized protein BKA55DRAFT_562211 [Fusarium redolens]KAH7259208.1 hypothetical protein BKA55DRAFT_562211 [Fusarium redolens]
MRVSLPVDPKHKTAGEVATLKWLSQHSTMPVPRVIAFDDTRDNQIGFEWILMEYEQWQLRKVYSETISQQYPQWDKLVAKNTLKVDFLGAVARCADGILLKGVEKWVDAVWEGERPRLGEILQS